MNHPVVISIPHCSNRIPEELKPHLALSDDEIIDSKDFGTEEIFGDLPAKKILKSQWSRLAGDLNRAPDNRGPKGIVAETDYRGRKIYLPGRYPDQEAIDRRIQTYYEPYHKELGLALAEPGIKGLFDCHSLNGTGPADAPDAGKKRKDIIISNNGDKTGGPDPMLGEPTCPAEIIHLISSELEEAGFSVAVNDPYRGGFITVHYGRQLYARGGFAVQIEMNQDLYMTPGSLVPNQAEIRLVRSKIHSAFEKIFEKMEASK